MDEFSEQDFQDLGEFSESDFTPKSIFSKIGVGHGGTSNVDIIKSGLAGTARDVGQIPASFINQLLLNLPRTAVEAYGGKYPEEKGVTSTVGRALSYGAGVAGGIKNPLINTFLQGGRLIPTMLKSATIAPLYGSKDMFDPKVIAKKAATGALVAGAVHGATKGVSNVRDYAGNKVSNIRAKFKGYQKSEYDAYENAIDTLKTNTGKLKHGPLFENATKIMQERNLYDPLTGNWAKPLNKIDSQLMKSYTELGRKANSGKPITTADVVTEWRNIRDSIKGDYEAREVANKFLNGIKDQIDDIKFSNANKRYAGFKAKEEVIDKAIGVKGNQNKYSTAKGERYLTKGAGETKQARETTRLITETTGESLKGAKLLSALNQASKSKALRYAVVPTLAAMGLGYGLSRRPVQSNRSDY